MTLAKRAGQYKGVIPLNPPNVQIAQINPSSQSDFRPGDIWLNETLATAFMWSNSSWIALGSGASGGVVTLTGNSGGALSPSAGNINVVGTGSLTVAGSGSTLTAQLTGLTAHAVLVGAGSATITKLTVGTDGQVLLGATGADPAFGTLTSTTGVSFTAGAAALAVDIKQGGFKVNSVSGTTQALAVQNSYVCNNASATTLTLPASAAVGDMILICGGPANAAGWVIAQNSGQTIHQAAGASTTGATGTATSGAHPNESILLMCVTANTDFVIMYANDTVVLA